MFKQSTGAKGRWLLGALIVTSATTGFAQTVTDHPASWFDPNRAFFFALTADGGRLFVNRSTTSGGEELVAVPTAGGATTVWHTNPEREIFERIAVSGDGGTLAFAKGTGSRVYALTAPGASPAVVADVTPDADPRQLALSRDGRWVAFTASSVRGGGPLGPRQVHLYVAATDGSARYRITGAALPGKYIAFALSADGGTVVWADDPVKGPRVAKRDGSAGSRLPAPNGGIVGLSCSADGSRVYCVTGKADGVLVASIPRAGASWTVESAANSGRFLVSSESGAIHHLARLSRTGPGECSAVTSASSMNRLFTFGTPRYAGSLALSGDGRVCVWRDGRKTRVWKAGS